MNRKAEIDMLITRSIDAFKSADSMAENRVLGFHESLAYSQACSSLATALMMRKQRYNVSF